MSEELILDNMNNSHVTVEQDDSISLPDLELVEEFMFGDSLQIEVNRVNSQTVIEPIPQCENTQEYTEQSKDQPLSTYDTSESEKGSDSDDNQPTTTLKGKHKRIQNVNAPIPLCENTEEVGINDDKIIIIINNSDTEQSGDHTLSITDTSELEKGSDSYSNQPTTTLKRKRERKQNADELIPTCKNTEVFGDKINKIVINNFDTEQSKHQPISTSATSEKGSDSDSNQPTTTIKRKLRRSQRSAPKDLDFVIAQRKPSLECVCKKSLPNFKSLSEHFRLEHPNELIPMRESREEFGDKIIINDFDTEQSKDQPISSYDTSEKGSDSDDNQPTSTIERKRRQKQNADEPTPTSGFDNKDDTVIINNFDNEQSKNQPISTSDKSEKGSDSDDNLPTATIKRKRRQRSDSKDLDAIIAQWKPSLECVVCKKSVANFLSLSLHFRNEHPNERCRVECCSRRIYLRCRLAKHARLHFNPDKVKCKLCDSYFANISWMHHHMRVVHFTANIEISDEFGNSKLRSKSMQLKRKQKADQPIPTCEYLEEFGDKNDNNFDTEQSKDQPISTCDTSKKGSDSDGNQPTTTIKRKQRSDPKDLDAVIAQWKPSLECVVCKKSVANFRSLSLHFRNEHPNERCHVECCSRRFYSRNRVVDHARRHINPNTFKCNQCDSYYGSRAGMHVHMGRVHFTPYIEISDKIGNYKLRSKSSIECVICKTSFAEFSLLKSHYRQDHPTEVCYTLCCERRFYQSNAIEEHMQLHRDPDAFKCEICGKRLCRSDYLREHMHLHRDPNAFKCEICGKRFCSSLALKKHMRQYHSNIKTAEP